MNDTHVAELSFTSLQLSDSLLRGLAEADFTHCTPIQAKTLPLAFASRDVAGQAQTGTGKTAAFLLAMMQHLLIHPPSLKRRLYQPRAIILAPTRELALQIGRDASLLGRYTGLRIGVIYGGTGYETQRRMLNEGLDVVIGTPGRLIDYFKQKVFDLRAIQVMVLDEADRMFDLGFIRDIRYLLRRMPPPDKRLGLLFSATLSWRVIELAYEYMNNPEVIRIEPEQVTAERIHQQVYYVANDEKIPLLIGLLQHMDPQRTIVFANTKRTAETVNAYLKGNGFKAAVLSGDVPQKQRQRLLRRFFAAELTVLVATDVAARGLHIPDVSHVFNYDLPQDAEDYVHRIGRTARLGAEGDAISFACEDYAFSLPEIEQYVGHKLPTQPVTDELLAAVQPPSFSRSRRTVTPRPKKPGTKRQSFKNKKRKAPRKDARS